MADIRPATSSESDSVAPFDYVTSMWFGITAGDGRQLIRMNMAYNIPNTVVKRSSAVGSFNVLVCTRGAGEAV